MQTEDIAVQDEWLHLVVAGRTELIDNFWGELGGALPTKWSRDLGAERDRKPRGSSILDSRCFRLDEPAVRVWLYRVSPHRVQSGTVEQIDPTNRSRYLMDIAHAIRSFRRDVLDLTVERCGLKVSSERLGPHSLVPNWIAEQLWAFSEAAALQWPPTGKALEQWREFVITAYQNNAAFDTRELKRWLTDKGWSADAADQLVAQKDKDVTELGKYDDLRQPA
jgi:hypothetical protein